MSVIVVTDHYETVRQLIAHIRAQTARDQVELVIVTSSPDEFRGDQTALSDFSNVQIVETGSVIDLPVARAAGVRRATAPLVVFTETHAFPNPDWAEALIRRHRGAWAAVGPAVGNANSDSMVSWAGLLLEYGPWLEPVSGGPMDDIPGHNSSYKRAILLDYGAELESMLEAESIMHWYLRDKGYQLYLEPKAKIYHLNVTLPASSIFQRYLWGRIFAAARGRRWSPFLRFLYVLGSPLIPLVRLRRILRELHRPGRPRSLVPRVLPPLLTGLVVQSLGELAGYAFGAGTAKEQLSDIDLHRSKYIKAVVN